MQRADYNDFVTALVTCFGFYGKPVENPEVWFSLLAEYEISDVRSAIRAHMQDGDRGRFSPLPADLIAKIPKNLLTPNEAWSLALQACDERETVITCDLIDKAMESARPIMDIGDKIGARMAFIAAYERLAIGAKPVWRLSLGFDRSGWLSVAERAQSMGLIGKARLNEIRCLTAPPAPEASAIAGLLTGPKAETELAMSESNKIRWRKLREEFQAAVDAREAERAAEKRAQAEAFEAVRNMQMAALAGDQA